jgi:hypothetical protein
VQALPARILPARVSAMPNSVALTSLALNGPKTRQFRRAGNWTPIPAGCGGRKLTPGQRRRAARKLLSAAPPRSSWPCTWARRLPALRFAPGRSPVSGCPAVSMPLNWQAGGTHRLIGPACAPPRPARSPGHDRHPAGLLCSLPTKSRRIWAG